MVILDQMSFQIDPDRLFKKIRLDPEKADAARVRELLAEAAEIGRPKGMYQEAFVEEKGSDYVIIQGIKFESRILRRNLEKAQRVFPYLATAGRELMEWGQGLTDILENYWGDVIQELVLAEAIAFLLKDMERKYHPGKTASMNPGSLRDWPIQAQSDLFQLLAAEEIGVRLTDSYLMVPQKSVSGMRFPTDFSFENCQLCRREACPSRRAPYDQKLLQEYRREI